MKRFIRGWLARLKRPCRHRSALVKDGKGKPLFWQCVYCGHREDVFDLGEL